MTWFYSQSGRDVQNTVVIMVHEDAYLIYTVVIAR